MTDKCIFLQARMTSKRLPGKSIKIIGGYPLVVLAALRAANTGLRVVVVTSIEKSDDILFEIVSSYGIECFRGNLSNVLLRFKEASDFFNLQKKSLLVRLTGDNVVPDGKLIEELIQLYEKNAMINYVGANHPDDNLPYGVNAEVFKVQALDDAFLNATNHFDLEHVTPWIKRHNYSSGMLLNIPKNDNSYVSSKLNLTIDSSEEFELIKSVFNKVDNPIEESWYKICQIVSETILN